MVAVGVERDACASRARSSRSGGAGRGRRARRRSRLLGQRRGALARLGSVGGLGNGERVYAVRFIGDTGYVVTFRQVDPLYTARPVDAVAPGRARRAEDPRLLGVPAPGRRRPPARHRPGRDDDGRVARRRRRRCSTSPTSVSPKRLDAFALGNGLSEAEQDHHAFLWWPRTGLAVIPLQAYGDTPFVGALGLRVRRTDGIAEVGPRRPSGRQPGVEPVGSPGTPVRQVRSWSVTSLYTDVRRRREGVGRSARSPTSASRGSRRVAPSAAPSQPTRSPGSAAPRRRERADARAADRPPQVVVGARATCTAPDPCRAGTAAAWCRAGSGGPAPCRSAPRRRARAGRAPPRARRRPSGSAPRSGAPARPREAAAPLGDLGVARGRDRGRADVVELAVVVEETEQERRDPALAVAFQRRPTTTQSAVRSGFTFTTAVRSPAR